MSSRKRKKNRAFTTFIIVQLALLLALIGGLGFYYLSGYGSKIATIQKEARSLVAESSIDTFRQSLTSVVYDASGNVISILKSEKDAYYIDADDIPIYAKQAIVSVEDKQFYEHSGVDYKAIIRAAYAMFRNQQITEGASTITQQLVKFTFLTSERTWDRKITEIFTASEMEKKYSKDQILEFYLNNIYFANGYYGIQAASQGYFSCDVNQLSLSQIAFLLAIPNSPTYYDPVKNYDNTIDRRNKILKNMLEDQKISQSTYMDAYVEEIKLNRTVKEKHNYIKTYTDYCATRTLMEIEGFEFRNKFESAADRQSYEQAYEEAYNACNAKLFTGGYRIFTSINMDMQRKLQASIDEGMAKYTDVNDEGIYAFQSAGVCIDNTSGLVQAIVGGRYQEVNGYTLNRAYQSFRQPGSAIKPLIVYTPLLERNYNENTIVMDEPIEDGPGNADGAYMGELTFRQAVAYSRNTVAWNLFSELGFTNGLNYLLAMDFDKIDKEDYRATSAIGGFTYGVSPLEMASAFTTIENDGFYRKPNCIYKIVDVNGVPIYQHDSKGVQIYDTNAARAMTDILTDVVDYGTAKNIHLGDMPIAGKTGTTNSNKDGWFIGYSPYYTTSIWVGYDMPKKVPGLTGGGLPANIWQNFMSKIHEGLAPIDFSSPIRIIDYDNVFILDEEPVLEETINTGDYMVTNTSDGNIYDSQTGERLFSSTQVFTDETIQQEYDQNTGNYYNNQYNNVDNSVTVNPNNEGDAVVYPAGNNQNNFLYNNEGTPSQYGNPDSVHANTN